MTVHVVNNLPLYQVTPQRRGRCPLSPAWNVKFIEGKMFQRLQCGRCLARFNFPDTPRVTRIARCPVCGSYDAQPRAAA